MMRRSAKRRDAIERVTQSIVLWGVRASYPSPLPFGTGHHLPEFVLVQPNGVGVASDELVDRQASTIGSRGARFCLPPIKTIMYLRFRSRRARRSAAESLRFMHDSWFVPSYPGRAGRSTYARWHCSTVWV
jgi:hypothetical protein